jgi:hypothetical protein
MEHKPFVDLQAIADLKQEYRDLTRQERLTRWAELLESQPHRELEPLREIEWKEPQERRAVRADNSPLTVAYEDPVLRGEGLASDRLGDVMDFFEVTERDAHSAFCSCHLPASFNASYAAGRVRAPIRKDQALGSQVRAWFAGLFRW